MENIVKREEIYTGILKSKYGKNNIILANSIKYRAMLFSLTKENLAHDLIYTTPINYPIENINYNNIDTSIYIDTLVNMNIILKYLDYPTYLSQKDLNNIYKIFISHNWWIEHNIDFFKNNNIDLNIYNKLKQIGNERLGIPNVYEPCYSFIKRK